MLLRMVMTTMLTGEEPLGGVSGSVSLSNSSDEKVFVSIFNILPPHAASS
jgi:hypothetical protein